MTQKKLFSAYFVSKKHKNAIIALYNTIKAKDKPQAFQTG